MTRAGKVLQLSFAATRTRNGKHESNSPSRFIREVDSRYIANPLTNEDYDRNDDDDTPSFGGWGKKFGGQAARTNDAKPWNNYGRTGAVVSQKRQSGATVMPVRTGPTVVRREQPVPARVPDAEFTPTPILQLRAGQRIEHNRFGFGKIMEISGNPADLKAKISFDDHGEKILILKYAKIRVVDVV